MREREPSLVLMGFGGVSQGDASARPRVLRPSRDRRAASADHHAAFDRFDRYDPECDTEAHFVLLYGIGRKLDLRGIIDIVARASARGIKGARLAPAISHKQAARAVARQCRCVRPHRLQGAGARLKSIPSERVRSRWLKPPLDGARVSELLYAVMIAMSAPCEPGVFLLSATQRLERFMTLTDVSVVGSRSPSTIRQASQCITALNEAAR